MRRFLFTASLLVVLTLSGCVATVAPPTTAPTFIPEPTPTATPPLLACVPAFERRELQEPYQRHGGEARFTLSTAELEEVLAGMGIASACILPELGAPMLNVDWNSAETGPAVTGRMISLGFEVLYPGAGWSDGYLLYATYDFAAGTEYDTFATREDYDALRSGALPESIEVDGVPGFTRVQPASLCMGVCPVYRAWIFPFETDYVAVVYRVGEYDGSAEWDTVAEIEMLPPYAGALDGLATTLRFASVE